MSFHMVDNVEITDAEWLRLLRNDLERQDAIDSLDPSVELLTDTQVVKALEDEFNERAA